ncbi:NACHT domain-containing protein [Streptomyces sp. enrichment culture]|uniref:NACHT domain-containing protein n=1 Tax=Streptomyces sp. enrichment culture TaxID=1795815 RepID=UPI003F5666C6
MFAQRVPTRRLVVLGEPGSGKTMLLVRLLQDLDAQRIDGGPVPALFSLASRDPRPRAPQGGFRFRNRVEIITRLRAQRNHAGLQALRSSAAPPA